MPHRSCAALTLYKKNPKNYTKIKQKLRYTDPVQILAYSFIGV